MCTKRKREWVKRKKKNSITKLDYTYKVLNKESEKKKYTLKEGEIKTYEKGEGIFFFFLLVIC